MRVSTRLHHASASRLRPTFLLAVSVGVLLAVTTAAAQQTWWIQSADYGAGQQRQDVTNTLRRLVSGPNFKVTNTNMGVNPAPGQNKSLRIVARDAGGNVRDFHYKEGAVVDSRMFTGGPNSGRPGWGNTKPGWGNNQPGWGNNYDLRIVSAKWGFGSQMQDVTSRLQSMVRNNRLSVTVTPESMGGDPSYGNGKILTVIYQYQGKQQNSKVVPEGAVLRLP